MCVSSATGTALVEVYDLSPDSLSTVSVTATVPATDTIGATPAVFTFTRVGLINTPVTVDYILSGTATAGTDFEPLPGRITIPAGATSATVSFIPRGQTLKEGFDDRFERKTDETGTATFEPNDANYHLIVAHHADDKAAGEGYTSTKYSATISLFVPAICPCCGE